VKSTFCKSKGACPLTECVTSFFAEDTPFEGGVFKIKLKLGADFPAAPPKGLFASKIFHPNVSAKGDICVNTLKKDWKPEMGIKHVLLARIRSSFAFVNIYESFWRKASFFWIFLFGFWFCYDDT
jgi:ubiquitin-protein ligase